METVENKWFPANEVLVAIFCVKSFGYFKPGAYCLG